MEINWYVAVAQLLRIVGFGCMVLFVFNPQFRWLMDSKISWFTLFRLVMVIITVTATLVLVVYPFVYTVVAGRILEPTVFNFRNVTTVINAFGISTIPFWFIPLYNLDKILKRLFNVEIGVEEDRNA